MDLESIRNALQENGLEQKLKEEQMTYMFDLLETDIFDFKNQRENNYLLETIPYLYKCFYQESKIKQDYYERLLKIRHKIKDLLQENSLSKENHKILKVLIGRLEIILFHLPNSYDPHYQKEKLELLYYLIFSIKNSKVLQNILSTPHQLNITEENGFKLIKEIILKYLDVLNSHVENEHYHHLDELLYYDQVLKIVLAHNKNICGESQIKELDKLFVDAEEQAPKSFSLQERYLYFLYKWREIFVSFLTNPKEPLDVSYSYSKEELERIYLIQKQFSPSYQKIANTVYISTKFKEVTPSMRRIYTIDGSGTVELDDGFSCTKENNHYRLGIHITNPLSYLKEDSLIFKQAIRRVSSIYLSDSTIFLFPKNLATDLFSLNRGNVRNCLNFYIDIDIETKNIIRFEPQFGPVFVKDNYTYRACNQILKNGYGDKKFVKTLANIQTLLPFLRQFYKIDDMYKKMTRSKRNSTSTNITGSTKAEQIIETLMIFANYSYAKYTIENKIPCLFRNHEQTPFYKEYLEKYIALFQKEKENLIYANELKILKSMYPASFYGATNLGHYGLGVTSYTHITSPDRRIADDFNMLMLEEFLKESKETCHFSQEELQKIGEYINARERSLNAFVDDYAAFSRKRAK